MSPKVSVAVSRAIAGSGQAEQHPRCMFAFLMIRMDVARFNLGRIATAVGWCLAVVLMGSSCSWAADAETPELPIVSYRLENGLKVALSQNEGAPRTTVCVAYHVGSKNERVGLTGFAHFFEHMMFRGTKNVPSFDTPLRKAGGSPNAFTNQDVTVYYETIPNNYLERALYLEAERMGFLSSALDQMKFDTEREVVKNERRQRMENKPYGLADETLSTLVYPKGHPYSWSVIGSMDDLSRATLDDLRRFFHEFYHPGNATLTLVGGFDMSQAKSLIETYFGPLATGPEVALPKTPPTPVVALREIQKDQVQFPKVYWAWPGVSETDPDAAALDLLAMILSSGNASRLKKALVVDSHVAVQVNAFNQTGELGGKLTISVTAAPGHSIEEIENILSAEIAKLRSAPPSEQELARVKMKHRTGELIGLASPQTRAFAIGIGYGKYDQPHFYKSAFTDYANVTLQDIERVIGKYFSKEKVVLVVEPVKPGEKESLAQIGAPLASTKSDIEITDRTPADGPDWTKLPSPAERSKFEAPIFRRRELKNGLEVWVAPWRMLPLVSTRLLVRTGSAADPEKQAGLASLTAKLWNQGTQDQTSTEFVESLDALGTAFRVSAGTDTSQISFTVEKNALAGAMDYLGQVVVAPRFDPSDFSRERSLTLSGLASGPDSVGWIAGRVFPRLLYGKGHPIGTPGAGFTETVKQLSIDNVKQFYSTNFSPKNATLIIVGDVETDSLVELLESTIGQWDGNSEQVECPAPTGDAKAGTVYLVDKPGAVQSIIVVGRIWKDRKDKSYYATRIGNRALGGDFQSRINMNLRQKNGYTYGANSGFRYRLTGSNWLVSTSVRSGVTAKALKEILSELTRAAGADPLSDEEIATARDAELSAFPQSFETPSGIAGALAQLASFDLPNDYFSHYTGKIQESSTEMINEVIAELADKNQVVMLVVGDRSTVAPCLEAEGFTEVELLDVDGEPKDAP